MKRVRKFTSRSFQKRTPRYGMSKPKMPPMPKLKKFQEGGSTDDLVPRSMLPDRNAAQQKRDMDMLMEYYTSDEVRERAKRRAEESKKKKKEEAVIEEQIVTPEAFRREMEEENRRRRGPSDSDVQRARRESRIRTARKGGVMKSYNKGGSIDGCAIRGKTRGTII
jgi:hypothetical protein